MHTTSSPAEVSPSTTEPSPGMLVTSQSRRIIKSSSSIEMRTPPISLLEDVVARHQNNNSSSHHLQDFTSEGNNSPTVLGFRSRKIYDASCAPSLAAGMNSAASWGKERSQRQRIGDSSSGHDFIEATRPGTIKDGSNNNAVLSKAVAELLHSCLLLKIRINNKCKSCITYSISHPPSSTPSEL
eukprot:380793_1